MIIEYILIIVALVWVLAASISDIKTREVPDWLNYSLIAIGLGLRAINSIYLKEVWFFLYGLIGFSIMFSIGMIMYHTKQWGGGDSKLLMGLGAVFGSNLHGFFNPVIDFPFLVILIFNILLAGSFYGIFWSLFLAVKNRKRFSEEIRKFKFKKFKIILLASLIFIIVLSIISINLILYLILFVFSIIFLTFMFVFMKAVENSSMYQKINVNQLTEGDWVAEDIVVKGKIICSIKDLELTKKQIEDLKKFKIKKVLVKIGIPFVPSFFIGLVITLVFGNLLYYLI